MKTIKLGQKVKDTITGFTGIATSRHEYLNGCVQYGVQGKIDKDGIIPEIEHIDEEQLTVMSGGIKKESKPSGGGFRDYPQI